MRNPGPDHRARLSPLGILTVLAVVLLTSASTECGGLIGVCTDIGCSDGLSVRVSDDMPGPATVHVTANGQTRTFQCDPAYMCIGFFEGWSPAHVDVDVVWEGGSFSAPATPLYELVYPNGRRCGPECRQGTVMVSLP